MNRTFFSFFLALVCICLLSSCTAINSLTEGPAVANFIAGRNAERKGDLKVALDYFQNAVEAANQTNASLGYVPSEALQFNERSSLSTTRLEASMIYNAYNRVYSKAAEYILKGHIKDVHDSPVTSSSIIFRSDWTSKNDNEVRTTTDAEGYFTLKLQGGGLLSIQTENPLLAQGQLKIVPEPIDSVNVNGERYSSKSIVSIVLKPSVMAIKYTSIKALFQNRDYEKAISYGDSYLEEFNGKAGNRVGEISELIKNAKRLSEQTKKAYQQEQMNADYNQISKSFTSESYNDVVVAGNKYIENYKNENFKIDDVKRLIQSSLVRIEEQERKWYEKELKRFQDDEKKRLEELELERKAKVEKDAAEHKAYKESFDISARGAFRKLNEKGINLSLKEKRCWIAENGDENSAADLNFSAAKIGYQKTLDTKGKYSYFPSVTFKLENLSAKTIKINKMTVAYTTGLRSSDVVYIDRMYPNQTISPGKKMNQIVSVSKWGYSGNRDSPVIAIAISVNDTFCEDPLLRIGSLSDYY